MAEKSMRIVILEDNQDRLDAMHSVIGELAPHALIEFFNASHVMIDHLEQSGLSDIQLISLDNDLELLEGEDETLIDPGDGVAVALWLAPKEASIPVIIHTTNASAGDEIEHLLASHEWNYQRIVPYGAKTGFMRDGVRWCEVCSTLTFE